MNTIKRTVLSFPTKCREGFTKAEEFKLLQQFPNLNLDKYYDKLNNSVMVANKGYLITSYNDIIKALEYGIEKQDIPIEDE